MLESALNLARRGWFVFPCQPRGKSPLTEHGYKDASKDVATIRAWAEQYPDANIGIDCGRSGILVLDVDGPQGDDSLLDLGVAFPDTVTVRTGKGRHYYFKSNGKNYKNAVSIKPGLDIRTAGGSVIAPGSTHANGNAYEFVKEQPLAEIPEWLEELLQPFERKSDTSAALSPDENKQKTDTETIAEGTRNVTLTGIAGTLRARGLSFESIFAALQAENARRCKPPLPASEVRSIAESVSQYELTGDLFNHTDLGNAERLVHYFGKNFRFCHEWNEFLVWTDQVWKTDTHNSIVLRARETTRRMYEEAYQLKDEDERKALATWALRSETRNKITAMIDLAKSLVPIKTDKLDADPLVMCALNGVVDLTTGELVDFERERYLTKQVPVEYDQDAKCERWLSFLSEIMDGNQALVEFLQRAIGYGLTGSIKEQCLFILHGSGANGKSTFLDVVMHLLGDYSLQTQPETIMQTRKVAGQASPELAGLPGIRFLCTIESSENRKLNESLIKQLTGGDRILARNLYSDYFEFMPEFKLWLASNHLPTITGTDHAIWRRIRKVPFLVTIPEDDQDKELPAKLKNELPGILAWAVQGCLEWQRRGLDPPMEVLKATTEYRSEMDVIQGFLDDCTDADPEFPTPIAQLYQVYERWCEQNGEKSLSQRILGRKLRERGLQEKRTPAARCWQGIIINDEWTAKINE